MLERSKGWRHPGPLPAAPAGREASIVMGCPLQPAAAGLTAATASARMPPASTGGKKKKPAGEQRVLTEVAAARCRGKRQVWGSASGGSGWLLRLGLIKVAAALD